MSRFLMEEHRALPAYIPGEHQEGKGFLRLNTNESPYPPSPGVKEAIQAESDALQYYNDPDCTLLRNELAKLNGVAADCILAGNGSDEVLYFAIDAFADAAHPLLMPDITYTYYDLFAAALQVEIHRAPLKADFSVDVADYLNRNEMIILANPNAPTGRALAAEDIRKIAQSNPDRVVLIDEAYMGFGAESAAPLTREFMNLLVVRTFSKAYSLAGGRLGYAIGCKELIADMEIIRNAVNVYSVSRLAQAAGVASCRENDYYVNNCRKIMASRAYTKEQLEKLDFSVIPSLGNFLFVTSKWITSAHLQKALRDRGILVRRWDDAPIRNYTRITIGTQGDMERLIREMKALKEEMKRADS